eukprot:6558159-Lingulodinium_polyedra.AAC.1
MQRAVAGGELLRARLQRHQGVCRCEPPGGAGRIQSSDGSARKRQLPGAALPLSLRPVLREMAWSDHLH